MIAVIFEVEPQPELRGVYLDIAADLRPLLDGVEGFISIERFQSLSDPGKILSLSFWQDEDALCAWRNLPEHRHAQEQGRDRVFRDYRLRIAEVTRDYGMTRREVPRATAAPTMMEVTMHDVALGALALRRAPYSGPARRLALLVNAPRSRWS